MNHLSKRIFAAILTLAVGLAGTCWLQAEPKRTEAELIDMLQSPDNKLVLDALDRLPNWYPDSSARALPYIRRLMRGENIARSEPKTASQPLHVGKGDKNRTTIAKDWGEIIPRKAARSFGNYHAPLEGDDLEVICRFLKRADPDAVMDALKTLRELKTPEAVPKIVPLLKHENHNILRDTCRTLAVIGDKSIIPNIQPLTKDIRLDVRGDALAAIQQLQAKP